MLDWGKLVRHLDLCHYTPPRSPSVCCLLCLLEDRSLSCTVQSHYGLSVTPSFLLGCSQEGIKGIRYRSVSAKFWLTKDKDKHMQACMLEHTHTRWLQTCCQNWRRVIHCYGDKEVAWYSGACGDVTAPCLWLAFREMGNSSHLGRKACSLSTNAEIIYFLITAASLQLEFGTVAWHHCRTWHIHKYLIFRVGYPRTLILLYLVCFHVS